MRDGHVRARGVVPSAPAWCRLTGTGDYWETEPEQLIRLPPLTAADASTLRRLAPVSSYVAPAAGVATLPDAVVALPVGGVITSDGYLVADLIRRSRDPIEEHPLWTFSIPEADLPVLPGTSAVIAGPGAAFNFSHFLGDSLPRLRLLREMGERIDHLLVASTSYRWQRDALEWLGVDPDIVISLEETGAVRAQTLLVPNRTGHAPRVAPWARRVMPIREARPGRGRRVFLTRTTAGRRRLDNEPEASAYLRGHHFDVVDPAALGLREQLELIAGTEIIVMQHGSAQIHLLMAAPGGGCVEIVNRYCTVPEAWALSALAGWRHAMCLATATTPGASQSEADQKNLNVRVDLRELDEALTSVLRG